MKLILDQNLVTEVTKVPLKVQKNAVCYNGRNLEGEDIELFDVEGGKIAPIVRFLITWKKKRFNIWLILWAILLSLILIVGVVMFVFWNKKEITTPKQTLTPVKTTIQKDVKPIVLEWTDVKELKQELEKVNWQLAMAEDEIVRLNSVVDDKKTEVIYEEKLVEVEKEVLRDLNDDERFIMYLWNIIYKKCQLPEFEDKCSKIYFNFLKNAK